ncbi:hypothetical protein [Sebaldella sp. S0638]|uniref:hypothetical protein n=1 Tax=Sebaldella sp. S0638 TaxID=2957809 RepID=UPI00209F8587|nr:hypothetical protein [Sebaldella sp. S0638]MCP1226692.1 hypothetical protein [Sebaldella sp. S0638]
MKSHITDLDKLISQRILKIRNRLEIPSYKIADYLNVSSSFVRAVESHTMKYNVKHIYLIVQFFNEYDEFIDFNDIFPERDDELIVELQETKKVNNKYQKEI